MSQSIQPVQVEHACFRYREREVLHDVSFSVGAKDMVAIVGPNGGGKTTLIQLLLGLIIPQHGRILLLGANPKDACSRVGYVPQSLQDDRAFPITAREVVEMGLLRFKMHPRSRRNRCLEALESTGAAHLSDRRFGALSGGERQRVLLAAAIVTEPELLLLDEPTANVDPQSAHALHDLFGTINQRIPVLWVSHNLQVVSRRVTHVLCVNRTAAMHSISDVMVSTFRELYGGEWAVIAHDQDCVVTDPSRVPPHPDHGDSLCGCHHPNQ